MTPRLTLGPIAKTVDEAIDNLLLAWRNDPTPEGGTVRWALESLKTARAALEAVKQAAEAGDPSPAELLEIVAEGMTVAKDD